MIQDGKTEIYKLFGVEAQPTNIVIDRKGKVVKVIEGADLPTLEAAIAGAVK